MNEKKKLSHDAVWDVCSITDSTAPNSLIEDVGFSVLDGSKANDCKNSMNISTIAFSNSSEIHIGDRVICNGPITVDRKDANNKKSMNVHSNSVTSAIKHFLSRHDFKFKFLFVALTFIILSATVVGLILTSKSTKNQKSYGLKIISKEEWGAKPPDPFNQGEPLLLPLKKTIIDQTGMSNCYTQECCSAVMRELQDYHLSKKWGDIGYSFVVCNDGLVYEGVGWDITGAHTYGQNRKAFGIGSNGNFTTEVPNPKMITAGFSLMEEGVRLGKLTKDYKIYAFRQYRPSNEPGDAFYQVIKTWDRWSDKI